MPLPLPSMKLLQALKSAVVDRPPYCGGTIRPPVEDGILFFAKEDEGYRLDFTNLKHTILEKLAEACNTDQQEDRSLDSQHVSIKFDPMRSGLLDVIRDDLLDGVSATKEIRAELNRLSVYSPGSSTKTQREPPLNDTMFGTLVLILPTPHEGGDLVLHNDGIKRTLLPPPNRGGDNFLEFGYVAFSNGVEYEISEVHSGHVVTLVYHLHFESPVARAEHTPVNIHTLSLTNVLSSLLGDQSFLPNGGELAFGVQRKYPIEDGGEYCKPKAAEFDLDILRANDASLRSACEQLGLELQFNVAYCDSREADFHCELILAPKMANVDMLSLYEDNIMGATKERSGGRYIAATDEALDTKLLSPHSEWQAEVLQEKKKASEDITWVTQLTELTAFKNCFCQLENDGPYHEMAYLYGRGCFIVKVGTWQDRKTAS